MSWSYTRLSLRIHLHSGEAWKQEGQASLAVLGWLGDEDCCLLHKSSLIHMTGRRSSRASSISLWSCPLTIVATVQVIIVIMCWCTCAWTINEPHLPKKIGLDAEAPDMPELLACTNYKKEAWKKAEKVILKPYIHLLTDTWLLCNIFLYSTGLWVPNIPHGFSGIEHAVVS